MRGSFVSQSLIHQVSDSDNKLLQHQLDEKQRLNPLFIRSQIQIIFSCRAVWERESLNPLFIRSQIQIIKLYMSKYPEISLNPLFIRSQIQI